MSYVIQPIASLVAPRSVLFVPATRPALLAKALASAADAIVLDLEDSVAVACKAEARANAVQLLTALTPQQLGNKTLSVRINALDTPFWYRDVIDIVEGKALLHRIMIPKVGNAADVYAVAALAHRAAEAVGGTPLDLEVILESAAGLENVGQIVRAPHVVAAHFGCADYAASMGMPETGIGAMHTHYPADARHYPLVRMVMACRAAGVLPIDGPFGNYTDNDAYTASAQRALVLGCVGKWAIHPAQVPLANTVYSPAAEAIHEAERILAAMTTAANEGNGAVTLDGKLIDLASVRQAEALLKRVRA
jgi:malyl-CoA/(S)-citramalyl-CoA lyase